MLDATTDVLAEDCDALVVGGGPAGSTAATRLAMAGRDVVLLERETHPRFHIGESLLPRNADILERLGVLDQVAAIGEHKPGAEFVSDDTGRSVAFPFANSLRRDRTHAWQVRRSVFDEILFRNAAAKGARTEEGVRVVRIDPPADGGRGLVEAIAADGTVRRWAPRFVLDATGRDTFLAGKLGLKDSNKHTNCAAVYAHYEGVARREGATRGYISVHLAEDGWFWIIPLRDGVTSVGFVGNQSAFRGRTGTPTQLLEQRIAASPEVAARMTGATRVSPVHSAANYSYRAKQGFGEGWLLIGDAYGFVDPMFSSGVLVAMTGGELGAEAADAWLDDPARGRKLAARTGRELTRAMDEVGWLIYRINTPVLRTLFMAPRNLFWMRDGIINILAGNLRGDPRARLPVLAFKTVYWTMTLALRLGLKLNLPEGRFAQPARPGRRRPPQPLPAE